LISSIVTLDKSALTYPSQIYRWHCKARWRNKWTTQEL